VATPVVGTVLGGTVGAAVGATAGVVATSVVTGVVSGLTAGIIDLDNSARRKGGYKQIDDKKLVQFPSAKDVVKTTVNDVKTIGDAKPFTKLKNRSTEIQDKVKDTFSVDTLGKLDLPRMVQI